MNYKFVILAAGKGKRMMSDIPKALTPLGGKPLLQYLYESVVQSGIDGDPLVVIGPERQRLCDSFGGRCQYVVQEEQLGTGHALMVTKDVVADVDALIVLNGDEPFVSSRSLQKLQQRHEERGNTITLMTTTVPSFDDWYHAFHQWGRIVRGSDGHIVGITEYKDASEEQRAIREVNPSLFCFQGEWLWNHIHLIEKKNAQEEYYLTDLIGLAVAQGKKLSSIDVSPEEVVGINTPQEREIAEHVLQNRYG